MDALVANAWNILSVLWRVFLIAGPIALIAWAVLKGGHANTTALERAKLDAEARSDISVDQVGRGTPPPGF